MIFTSSLPVHSLSDQAVQTSAGLTRTGPVPNNSTLMSAESPATAAGHQRGLPEQLDAWRMVAAQRVFEGALPLASMDRLKGALVDTEGSAQVTAEFGTDMLRIPFVELRIDAKLPLECQRSLQRFALPVRIV